jgi:SAM-dependent methyltransferase
VADEDDSDWAGYYAALDGRPPRPLLLQALQTYGEVAAGATALDLGAGNGIESRVLLDAGFAVTAVDSQPAAVARLRELPVTVLPVPMQDADLPSVDLAYAGYALPFCPPDRFPDTWRRLVAAVRPGGLLACDLFGTGDDWASDEPTMTFLDRTQVTALLAGLDVQRLAEIDEEGSSFNGPKHWHRFEIVARVVA